MVYRTTYIVECWDVTGEHVERKFCIDAGVNSCSELNTALCLMMMWAYQRDGEFLIKVTDTTKKELKTIFVH